MLKRISGILVIALVLFASAACNSEYNKALKGNDYNQKFELAKKYYNSGDYFRALSLFDQLQEFFAGTKIAEKIMFYNAYSNYGLGNFTIASYLFQTYCQNYPNTDHTEESYYMYAYCIYLLSQPYNLDQTNTYRAMRELQLFINLYPGSKYVENCNNYLDLLRSKLATKTYNSALLYYNIGDYRGATVALNNTLQKFPELPEREYAEFLIFKAGYLYAKNSIEKKKKERYEASIESYQAFKLNFNSSEYMKEAEVIRKNIDKALGEIKTEQTTTSK